MGRPDPEVEKSELFLKLLERPAPSSIFPFPRLGDDGEPVFNVRVFVLPSDTLATCQLRARKWLIDQTRDNAAASQMMDEHVIGDRVAKEAIAESVHEDRAISGTAESSRPRYRRLFANAEDVGKLTADEVGSLWGAYLLTQMRFGPVDASFSDEREVNEWIGRIADGGRPFVLTLLRSHQRDALLLSLADRASSMLKLLASPPESWQTSLESLRTNWQTGTDSYTEPAAAFTPSPPEEIITQEDAMRAARELRRMSSITED